MALIRWRPMRNLLNVRDEMDLFFDDFFNRSTFNLDTVWSPNMDLKETNDKFYATIELPGLEKDDVNISMKDDVLVISGSKKREKEDKKENYHYFERTYGNFERSIRLPSPVNEKKIKAKFKNGILTIELAKNSEAIAKSIPISVE